ncbi:zinc knuckle CX2CX4HX4C containing protein [Tanacetum coccineum]
MEKYGDLKVQEMASKVSNVGGNPNNVGSGITERMTLRSVVNNYAHDDVFGAIQSVVSHVLGTKPAGNVNDETTMTNDGNEQASASFIETTGVTHRGAGEYADVMARLTSDEHKVVMVEALWKKFLAAMSDNNSNNGIEDTSNVPCHDSLAMKTAHINVKTIFYAGAAGLQSSLKLLKLLQKLMMNSKGFFFFKFESRVGLEAVLEKGFWMIHNASIILEKLSFSTSLLKEELTRIPVWVKLHDVPIQVFLEDGISLIATHVGKPIMLDSYTSSMCIDSWGRSSFVRCLIEVNSDKDLKESITIVCKIFGHNVETCPTKVESAPVVNNVNDRFQKVVKKKRNTNTGPTRPRGGFSGFVPSCFADLGLVPLSLSLFVLCHIGSWVFGQHFILCLYLESIQIELAEVFAFNLELFMDRLSLLNEHEHVTRLVHFGFSTQRLEQIAPVQLFNDWSEMSIEITCVSP